MTLNYSLVANVCCCHSGSCKDILLWEDLKKQLAPLISSRQIVLWDSGSVQAGQVQQQKVEQHLSSADIILLLISPDFLSCSWGQEQMELALRQLYQRQIHIIPILLYPCMWELTPIFLLKPLPQNRRPISTWPDRDVVLLEVAQAIYSIIQEHQMLSQLWINQQTAIYRQNFEIPFKKNHLIPPPPSIYMDVHTREKSPSHTQPLSTVISIVKNRREADRGIRESRGPRC